MYTYKIKEGEEHRIFINAVNHGDGTVSSETPLESALLTLVQDQPQPEAPLAYAAPQEQLPSQPIQPIAPPTEEIKETI